jgi:predicted DsbA family dithiol-disulfide isomerase
MSADDGIAFTPWPHASMPGFSLPALEAAKCVAKQSGELLERVHLRLYRAYFTESRNIGDPDEVARVVQEAAPEIDMARFVADRDAGIGRHAVANDYEAALAEHGVNAIPAVIVPATGRRLVGLADMAAYRAAIAEAGAR